MQRFTDFGARMDDRFGIDGLRVQRAALTVGRRHRVESEDDMLFASSDVWAENDFLTEAGITDAILLQILECTDSGDDEVFEWTDAVHYAYTKSFDGEW